MYPQGLGEVQMHVSAHRGLGRVGQVVAWFLALVGALITIGAAILWLAAVYPLGLSRPVAAIWAATGSTIAVVGLLTLGFPRWPSREQRLSWIARSATLVGVIGLLLLAYLVLARASTTRDATMSDSALYVPTTLGLIALGLGILGVATSHGEGPTLRWSLAALIMGIGSAAIPAWLWWNHRYFFASCYEQLGGCLGP